MEQFGLQSASTQTNNDNLYRQQIGEHFNNASGEVLDKLSSFTRFVSRQNLSTFLAKNEIFKKIINIHGNIIECGVFKGTGLMTWAQLSAIYEPLNHNRRIIGFDSFEGFPSISKFDTGGGSEFKEVGGLKFTGMEEINESIRLYDLNRPVGHLPKVELVKGDALKTIPDYLDNNQHLVVSLLYLDFDLYEPTKTALEYFLPRMPKGSIIAFDELNQNQWPGETKAVMETVGISNIKIERFSFMPQISFACIS